MLFSQSVCSSWYSHCQSIICSDTPSTWIFLLLEMAAEVKTQPAEQPLARWGLKCLPCWPMRWQRGRDKGGLRGTQQTGSPRKAGPPHLSLPSTRPWLGSQAWGTTGRRPEPLWMGRGCDGRGQGHGAQKFQGFSGGDFLLLGVWGGQLTMTFREGLLYFFKTQIS